MENQNDEIRNPNQIRKPNDERPVFDLEERTAKFGENVIRFAKELPATPVTKDLISQAFRAATSVGANYAEADDRDSRKDFKFKIGLCRREARESKHWMRCSPSRTSPPVTQPGAYGKKLTN